MGTYRITLKFNRHGSVLKRDIEAADRAELNEKIKQDSTLNKNKDRLKIQVREPL